MLLLGLLYFFLGLSFGTKQPFLILSIECQLIRLIFLHRSPTVVTLAGYFNDFNYLRYEGNTFCDNLLRFLNGVAIQSLLCELKPFQRGLGVHKLLVVTFAPKYVFVAPSMLNIDFMVSGTLLGELLI